MVVQVLWRLGFATFTWKRGRETESAEWFFLPTGKGKEQLWCKQISSLLRSISNNANAAARLCFLSPQTKMHCVPFSATIFVPYLYSHQLCTPWSKPCLARTAASPLHVTLVTCSIYIVLHILQRKSSGFVRPFKREQLLPEIGLFSSFPKATPVAKEKQAAVKYAWGHAWVRKMLWH